MQNMIQKLKTQTNQLKKQTRQIQNSNKALQEETCDCERSIKLKQYKTCALERTKNDLQRALCDTERDVSELAQCKEVLGGELKEEQAYQEQMKNLIAQLKRNIYEVTHERERVVKEIYQDRKILANLEHMKETVASDTTKLRADFKVAFELASTKPGAHDSTLTASQIAANVSTITKIAK